MRSIVVDRHDDRHRAFASGLSQEERLLIELRDVIYDCSWQGLADDLNARQRNEPFIIKLNTRISEDLDRIAKLKKYEDEHSINLRDYVPKY